MKTLKTLLVASAFVFGASAVSAQTSFELNKHQMGTHHKEAKTLDPRDTPTQSTNAMTIDDSRRREHTQQPNQPGVANEYLTGEDKVMDWTWYIYNLIF